MSDSLFKIMLTSLFAFIFALPAQSEELTYICPSSDYLNLFQKEGYILGKGILVDKNDVVVAFDLPYQTVNVANGSIYNPVSRYYRRDGATYKDAIITCHYKDDNNTSFFSLNSKFRVKDNGDIVKLSRTSITLHWK